MKNSFGGTSSESLIDFNHKNFNLPQPIILLENSENGADQDPNENYGWYTHDLFQYRYEGREVLPQIISDSDMQIIGKETDEYPNVTITKAGLNVHVTDTSSIMYRKP